MTGPRHLAFQDRTVTVPDREAVREHRPDPVAAPAPVKRRVAPSESNLKDAMRRINRNPIPQAIVPYASGGAAWIQDGPHPAAPPQDFVLAFIDENPVAQESESCLDRHATSWSPGE